jgi:transcriptional regulator with XRE-family HTH domain
MKKNESSAMDDERELESFEAQLKLLARAGQIPYPISEKEIEDLESECRSITLPPELEEKYARSVKMAYEDMAIEKGKRKLYGEVKVFGRYIQYIRKEAGISASRIAERLGKDKGFVEKLESGQISPLHIAKGTVADIMETFRINLKELVSAVKMSLQVSTMAGAIPVHARADAKGGEKERLEDISIAAEDLMYISSKKEQKEISVPEEFLEDVRAELERRGRTDLI